MTNNPTDFNQLIMGVNKNNQNEEEQREENYFEEDNDISFFPEKDEVVYKRVEQTIMKL